MKLAPAFLSASRVLAAVILAANTLVAYAQEPEQSWNRVSLSAQAGESVDNDRAVAVVFIEREGERPTHLAEQVNEAIRWAVDVAKAVEGIKIQTQGYQSWPIRDKRRITGWRVRQSVSLRSKDMASLGELVGQLQKRVALQSIAFELSPESREAADDRGIAKALARFRQRAQLVSQEMGANGYRIVSMNVNTSASGPMRPMMARGMMADSMRMKAAPSMEGGSRRVTVSVNGTIEMTGMTAQ